MSDEAIQLSPSDVVGAVQRRCAELAMHLNNHPSQIDCHGVQGQLVAMSKLISALAEMQQDAPSNSAGANGAEAHAQ